MSRIIKWIKVFFTHPMILYFFILPVYLPVRMLSEDITRYHHIMPSAFIRIDYFIYVFAQIAISGLLLALGSKWLHRIKPGFDSDFLSSQRGLAIFVSVMFIFSTYLLLSPKSYGWMFFASGVHYFCIAFFANLVILETKHFALPIDQGAPVRLINNTVFGINLNILGMISFLIMNVFLIVANIKAYAIFCVVLECVFLAYLFFVRQYGACLISLVRGNAYFLRMSLAIYGFILLFCVCISLAASVTVFIICLFIPVMLVLAYYLYARFDGKNVRAIFAANFSYGVVVITIMTPIIMLLFNKNSFYVALYSRLAVFEPIISGLFVLLILWLILRGLITSKTRSTYSSLFGGAGLVVLLPFIAWLILHHTSGAWMIALFLCYSVTESFTQYGVREIILKSGSDYEATLFNYYARMIWQGFVPGLYILVLSIFSHFFNLTESLFVSLTIMSVFSLLLLLFCVKFTRF